MSLASINRKIEALTAEMQRAAEAQDFETAARLRNEIAALKGEAEGSPRIGFGECVGRVVAAS